MPFHPNLSEQSPVVAPLSLVVIIISSTFLGLALDKKDYFFNNPNISASSNITSRLEKDCVIVSNVISCRDVFSNISVSGTCEGDLYACCDFHENSYCSSNIYNSYSYTAFVGVSITWDVSRNSKTIYHYTTDFFPVTDIEKELNTYWNKTFSMYTWNGPSFSWNSTLVALMGSLIAFFAIPFVICTADLVVHYRKLPVPRSLTRQPQQIYSYCLVTVENTWPSQHTEGDSY